MLETKYSSIKNTRILVCLPSLREETSCMSSSSYPPPPAQTTTTNTEHPHHFHVLCCQRCAVRDRGQSGVDSDSLRAGRSGIRRLEVGKSEFESQLGQAMFSSPKHPDRFWGPTSLLFDRYMGSFPKVRHPGRTVYHSPRQVPWLRMHGAISLLPLYDLWRGQRLPHLEDKLLQTSPTIQLVALACCIRSPLDSPLQYFVHSSVRINTFQGKNGGIEADLVSRRYIIIDHTLRVFCCLTDYHRNLTTAQDKLLLQRVYNSACSDTSFFREVQNWSSSSGMSLHLSRKQVACRQERLII